jgi:lipoprotein-releasing system permease protein
MRPSPILRIAITHIVSKKRQTVVAMLGVTFGIMVFIFQAGLITGLQTYMTDKIINNSPHVHVYREPDKNAKPLLTRMLPGEDQWVILRNPKLPDEDRKIRGANRLAQELARNPAVEGVAPLVVAQGILKNGVKEIPVTLNGVDIEAENRLFNLEKDQVSGDYKRMLELSTGIVLGKGVAEKLGAEVGDIATLSTVYAVVDMKVVAITQTGITTIDDNRAYVNIEQAQKILNRDMLYLTDLNLKLKNVDEADAFASQIRQSYNLRAQSWKEANAGIFGVFKIQNLATYLVIVSILIVAGFGIFNILMMMIYEKMTDIAILKSMGYRNADIRRLFMIEALFIGVVGGIMGLVAGFGACVMATKIEVKLKGLVTLDHLTINFDPMFYVSGFAFAILSTALAGYVPARRASLIDPVDIIRGK